MKYTLILLCIGLFVLVVDANHDCAGVGERVNNFFLIIINPKSLFLNFILYII